MDRKELLQSPEYWVQHIQLSLYNTVVGFLEQTGTTRTEFANKLGVSKGYVSQILNGDYDHKISKFVELALACGYVPQVSFIPLEKTLKTYDSCFRIPYISGTSEYGRFIPYEAKSCNISTQTYNVSGNKTDDPTLKVA